MTITELGALGEFVGAIAVVVTLAYLAVQVRQSKLVTLAATEFARDELTIRSLQAERDSPYVAPLRGPIGNTHHPHSRGHMMGVPR